MYLYQWRADDKNESTEEDNETNEDDSREVKNKTFYNWRVMNGSM